MEYIGRNNQTSIDAAIQLCGSVEAVYALCLANGIEITDDVQGREITYSKADIQDVGIVNALVIDGIIPAGKLEGQAAAGGIGYWSIGINFEIV